MSSSDIQNPFAPPRAQVQDPIQPQGEMILATRASRFLAVLVDGAPAALLGIVAAIAMPAYTAYQKRGGGAVNAGASVWIFLAIAGVLVIGYCIWEIVLVYRYGQTIGKRVMKIRVVRTDGSRVSFARFFFLRWLALAALSMIPIVGRLVGLIDPLLIFRDSSQCLHDNIADTKVVTAATSEEATLAGSRGEHLRTINF